MILVDNLFKDIIKMTENEFIKAKLDLLKLFISATLAAMFLIVVYNLQTGGVHAFTTILAEIILLPLLLFEIWEYLKIAKKLRNEKS